MKTIVLESAQIISDESVVNKNSNNENNHRKQLHCVFNLDGVMIKHDIEIINFHDAQVLSLNHWEALFLGDRQALDQMRELLGLALKNQPWSHQAISIVPQY
jgi:hypothetical protein